jgi:hypothetical protein
MRTRRILWLLLFLALPFAAPPATGQQPIPPEERLRFLAKEYEEIDKSANWGEIKRRRDIVLKLGDIHLPGALKILFRVFVDDREQVCRIPAMIGLGKQDNEKALKRMVLLAIRDQNDVYKMCLPLAFRHVEEADVGPWLADRFLGSGDEILRAAVIQSLGLLECEEAYDPLVEMLGKEEREVRIAYECLLAIARIGRERAFEVIVPYLDHEERYLREGAIVALGETGHPGAVGAVLPLAKDPFPRAQEAVCEVVAKLGAEEGVPTLIELLRTGPLRVIDTARSALVEIAGADFGLDPSAWERWWKDRKEGRERKPDPTDGITSFARYYGMNVLSDRVLFVLDISGSMKAGEPTRIETAREELGKTLDELNEKTLFNVVGFSGAPMWWRDDLVKATEENRADARAFVEKLSVGGGTNVYDTLEEALEKNRLVDTIFLLGDGSPSVGRYTEQEEILARIRWLNRFRKVRIHTIALVRGEVPRFGGRMGPGMGRGRSVSGERYYDEEEAARFLERLAAEHDGDFLKIDK